MGAGVGMQLVDRGSIVQRPIVLDSEQGPEPNPAGLPGNRAAQPPAPAQLARPPESQLQPPPESQPRPSALRAASTASAGIEQQTAGPPAATESATSGPPTA